MVMLYAEDFEKYNLEDFQSGTGSLGGSVLYSVSRDPRYDGLNRAQRRKAMAVEARAFRKQQKGRKRG